jgi:acetolactate synthase-1/2/3 large subunit
MVLLVGQVGSDMIDREAFQEVDYRRMYGDVAKWAAQIDRADRIPEYVAHAWRIAMSGRPGPVVLALPEDVLSATAAVADAPRADPTPAAADPAQVADALARLASARRPLALVGGSRWDPDACAALAAGCSSPAAGWTSGARTSTTTGSRITRAISALARIRSSPRACAMLTCSS